MGLLEQMKRERERRSDGRFFSLYRGVVTNVNDPENLGRVRAKVHELLGDTDETDWASPCVPFGGEGAGWLMLPKTNDAVWIAFEAGDLSRPVWIGFWFNKTDTPPEGAGPDVRVLQSKSGHPRARSTSACRTRPARSSRWTRTATSRSSTRART
jgi:uncharacterized protein involved in type VI secretion and phage assembly